MWKYVLAGQLAPWEADLKHIPPRRPSLAVSVLALVALLVAACGSGGSSAQGGTLQPGENGLIKVKIAETPGLPAAFTQFGVDKGFFKEQGLDVEVTTLQGGQTMVSAMLAGDVQFTGGDVVAFTTFRSRNVPVVIVRPGSGAGDKKGEDYQAIVASPKITSPKDLEGATVAVNELNNIGQLFTEMALERNYGVDVSTIKWAEIALPDVNGAIASGQIDAGYSLEPFQTVAHNQGLHTVLTPGVEYGANSQIGLVLTTEQFLKANADVVKAFQAAHLKTRNYILEHEQEYRDALVKLAGLQPEAASTIRLPAYHEHVNRETISQVVKDMRERGLIDKELDIEAFFAPDA
jgi:ABC-type nitrate/sulfonate/bicarbonate transport systems, periplasmic components